jgi:catechol 2,3-dioxygenase-like lactoylglutathione lyase family enzyme
MTNRSITKLKTIKLTIVTLTSTALSFLLILSPVSYAESKDALAPKSKTEDALALPLHTVTIATVSLQQSLLFYRDGMGLTVEGPIALTNKQIKNQRKRWKMPKNLNWDTYRFYRKGIDQSIQIQLLVLDKPMPSIHDSWNSTELGPFSMGFPNTDTIALDKKIRKVGFGALNVLESYPIPRTDGTTYQIDETIFNAPDFVHGVAITRGNGMPQLGPVDKYGMGGPAYSAQIIENSTEHLKFYTDVLGLEIRSDREFKSAGDKGAMNLKNGTVFRFAIVYSKGAKTGHMLFVDFRNIKPIKPKAQPSLPNLGIGMWTFPVTSIDTVISNARKYGSKIISKPKKVNSPMFGKANVATLRAPNGFLIEVFEAL